MQKKNEQTALQARVKEVVSALAKRNDEPVVGFDPSYLERNINIAKLVASGQRDLAPVQYKLSVKQVSRIALKVASLSKIEARLADGITDVRLPPVWAESFDKAAKFYRKTFCGNLELPGWKILKADEIYTR